MSKAELEDLTENAVALKWPSTLRDIADVLENELKKQDKPLPPDMCAKKLIFAMGQYFGGKSIYLPSGKILEIAIRNLEIYRAFNGHNIEELTRRYHLSEGHIYGIIREQRKLQKQENDKIYRS